MSAMSYKDAKHVAFRVKWAIFRSAGERLYTMVRHYHEKVVFAPLYIHTVKVVLPHLCKADRFNLAYTEPNQMTSTAVKLRWHRYQRGLHQREVAEYVGIDRTTYSAFEAPGRDYYPLKVLSRLAELYEVSVTELMDDYHLFIKTGQGQQVKALRIELGLTQEAFAKKFGYSRNTVKRWEADKIQMFKSTWEKLFCMQP